MVNGALVQSAYCFSNPACSLVGESSRLETAITVTGLKSGHFYNVRVIAVGNNNFQAGSQVIRLRTYNRDGRPDLGGRIPSNLASEDASNGPVVDSSDESAGVRSHGVGIEAASASEGLLALVRDQASRAGSRRNTGVRKHSPSTASEHPVSIPPMPSIMPEGSMQQLTERFEAIRGETEEVTAQVAKDADDFKAQMAELLRERDEKRQLLKEKEEASEKLKKEVHSSERLNRQAQTRKTQKEKALREKEAEKIKIQEDMKKWEKEILEMQIEKELWEKEKHKIATDSTKKVNELKTILRKRQNSLNSMEEEIRVKGLQIKELEEERQNLPGAGDDEESKELEAADRLRDLQWDHTERELMARYTAQNITVRNLEADLHKAQIHFQHLSARQAGNPLMVNGNSSGVGFDVSGQQQPKQRRNRHHKSRTNTISSPVAAFPIIDSEFPSASAYNNMPVNSSNFAPGPYFDMSAHAGVPSMSDHGMSDSDIRSLTAGAPLSPTATLLLPSNIFADDDQEEKSSRSFGPALYPSLGPSIFEGEQQYSPESSSRSASLISSPRTSLKNLQLMQPSRDSYHENDRHLLGSRHSSSSAFGVIGSPTSDSAQPASKRFGDLFNFPGKPRSKTMVDEGYVLGSLKVGQSQSFPRQGEDSELLTVKNRRTSFTSGWGGLPFLNRASTGTEITEGNAPAPARNVARRRRGFNMFSSSIDDPNTMPSNRDPGSPRPASIASSDLPRPSTDSALFGWAPSDSNIINRNSPLATNWSLNVGQTWSRPTSRRPSVQHGGSTTQLTSGIVSDDDDFLPPDILSATASPPPVGVIGTRPVSQMSANPKLNPAAPTFKAMFGLAKDTAKSDKKARRDGAAGAAESADDLHGIADNFYPPTSAGSHISRDQHSIRTQTSMAESYDSLEQAVSSTAMSDVAPTYSALSGKSGELRDALNGKETNFQKLLRKGSSSKFSIGSFRGKDVFGSKKGSIGDLDEGDVEGKSLDGGAGTSSPVITGEKGEKGGEWKGMSREGRMSVNWGRFSIKKKGRVSGEIERASETEGTEDEGRI